MPRRAADETDSLETSPFNLWDFNTFETKTVQADRTGTGKESIIELLKQCGDGTRCKIVVEWDGQNEGHAFCAKNSGGQIVFIDPQNGRVGEYVENYFNLVELGTTRWLRIDKLDIRESFRKDAIKNPYGKD